MQLALLPSPGVEEQKIALSQATHLGVLAAVQAACHELGHLGLDVRGDLVAAHEPVLVGVRGAPDRVEEEAGEDALAAVLVGHLSGAACYEGEAHPHGGHLAHVVGQASGKADGAGGQGQARVAGVGHEEDVFALVVCQPALQLRHGDACRARAVSCALHGHQVAHGPVAAAGGDAVASEVDEHAIVLADALGQLVTEDSGQTAAGRVFVQQELHGHASLLQLLGHRPGVRDSGLQTGEVPVSVDADHDGVRALVEHRSVGQTLPWSLVRGLVHDLEAASGLGCGGHSQGDEGRAQERGGAGGHRARSSAPCRDPAQKRRMSGHVQLRPRSSRGRPASMDGTRHQYEATAAA